MGQQSWYSMTAYDIYQSKLKLECAFRGDANPRCRTYYIVTLTLTYMTFEPQINRLLNSVEDYFSTKFQIIPIRGFRFIMLAYTPTPTS